MPLTDVKARGGIQTRAEVLDPVRFRCDSIAVQFNEPHGWDESTLYGEFKYVVAARGEYVASVPIPIEVDLHDQDVVDAITVQIDHALEARPERWTLVRAV